ncbi:S-adenosylmethionine:tRNA ribosyltransferase-isomerase [Streptomyces sp. NPDC085946]|uniref:S-adenosylmethionine:tRNA ribosyltransferase-isomerase n=1 Tax=Streptomyces sp. NPDC085946 TaxID=3365744 RepID=UPI0037D6BA1B
MADGLLTGLHEPEASHPLTVEAVAGRAAVDRAYEEAMRARYLWHGFGDVRLVLPFRAAHTVHCASNSR